MAEDNFIRKIFNRFVEEDVLFETQEEKARRIRLEKRLNHGGGYSTHIMRHEVLPDGNWVAFPTLFPGYDNKIDQVTEEWHEFTDEDWMPAYKEALDRNEVFNFTSEDEARIFAEGGWKND